jgi:excisionase family DNA binding protein
MRLLAPDGRLFTVTTSPSGDRPAEGEVPLDELVGFLLPVPDVAERLGVSPSAVRRMIEDRELLAVRVGEQGIAQVPGKFLGEEGPLAALRGTFTVLSDGGMSDEETVRWLFTPDPTLPVDGAPIDAIIGGFKTEVRRRAMEQAF